jgi:hypothetical protein
MANAPIEGRNVKDWVSLVLAACLFVSPWVVGFATLTVAAWNAWIIGIVLAIVTIAALSTVTAWEEWANLVLGLWLIASPWIVGFAASTGALWTHVILGVLVAAVSAWAVWDQRQDLHAHASS